MDLVSILIGTTLIILVIFTPGFLLSLAIFPKKDDLDMVERAGLSVLLGLTPQFLMYAADKNLSLKISDTSTPIIILVCVIGAVVWRARINRMESQNEQNAKT